MSLRSRFTPSRFHQQSDDARSTNLGDIMNSVVTLYLARMQAFSIEVVRDYRASEKLFCRVDDMRQAFSHLVSNALDAMYGGGRLMNSHPPFPLLG